MKNLHAIIYKITRISEYIIIIAIVIAISISMITLVGGLRDLVAGIYDAYAFQNFLGISFNILIGIEFLKVIYKYNVNTIIEVLLFAIARQLIVEHSSVYESFVGIAAIAVLFIIRKYLRIPELDNDEK
jgi:uncharacterized membrane protein (DUF373 family)